MRVDSHGHRKAQLSLVWCARRSMKKRSPEEAILRGSSQAHAQGLARLPIDVVLAELARRFDELLVWLADRPFFFAERPSVADLAIFGQMHMLQSGPTPQAAELIGTRPALRAYFARVDAATRGGSSSSVAA